jgi:hypothetical protein
VPQETLAGGVRFVTMTMSSIPYPDDAVHVQPGDYLVETIASGQVRLFEVRDLVKLRRLVPFFDDTLIDDADTRDSEPPAYSDHIYCVLTAFDGHYSSPTQAVQAIGDSELASDDLARLVDLARITPGRFATWRPE